MHKLQNDNDPCSTQRRSTDNTLWLRKKPFSSSSAWPLSWIGTVKNLNAIVFTCTYTKAQLLRKGLLPLTPLLPNLARAAFRSGTTSCAYAPLHSATSPPVGLRSRQRRLL